MCYIIGQISNDKEVTDLLYDVQKEIERYLNSKTKEIEDEKDEAFQRGQDSIVEEYNIDYDV